MFYPRVAIEKSMRRLVRFPKSIASMSKAKHGLRPTSASSRTRDRADVDSDSSTEYLPSIRHDVSNDSTRLVLGASDFVSPRSVEALVFGGRKRGRGLRGYDSDHRESDNGGHDRVYRVRLEVDHHARVAFVGVLPTGKEPAARL